MNDQTNEPGHEDLNYTVMPNTAGKTSDAKAEVAPDPLGLETHAPKARKWMIIGGAAILLILLGVLVYFLIINKKDAAEPEVETRLPKAWLQQNFGAESCADRSRCGDESDPDNDGLTNYNEFREGTNPNQADSDSDGLSDGDEVNVYKTDPGLKYTDRRELAVIKDFNDARDIADGYDPLTPGSKMTATRLDQIQTDTEKYGLHEPTITTLGGIASPASQNSSQSDSTETPRQAFDRLFLEQAKITDYNSLVAFMLKYGSSSVKANYEKNQAQVDTLPQNFKDGLVATVLPSYKLAEITFGTTNNANGSATVNFTVPVKCLTGSMELVFENQTWKQHKFDQKSKEPCPQ